MKRNLAVVALVALLVGCGSTTTPTPGPTVNQAPTSSPTPIPSPTTNPDLPSLALPAGYSGIPGPGAPTATIEAHTPAGSVPVGEPQSFEIGHCGLGSPIDFDGSLWDPTFGDDGSGGPLTNDQQGELINATQVELTIIDPVTALLVTPAGARVLLVRHDGARPYALCD
ncbi:MAG TPA: hypothetical protein VEX62_13335 [Candidatus Limnocylindrales bacterium]|nr:hypothetical protein [Candidatus Limnocylindrales bacterium]